MKLPEVIKVAGHFYSLKVMDDEWKRETNKHGDCDRSDLIIRVVRDNRFKETLIHEISHAIHHEYNVDGAKGEENIVTQFSTGLHQVLIDNPDLLKLLK